MTSSKESIRTELAFETYPATKRLRQLALNPIDLHQRDALSVERMQKYASAACGIKFLYGTERITDEVMQALVELSEQAHVHEKMRKVQGGEVMNLIEGYPSENRPVLHTATRDFFGSPPLSKQAEQAALEAKKEVEKLKQFMLKIDQENHFSDLVMVAIGGSELGPKAHYVALEHLLKDGRKVHFISNVDPDDASRVLSGLDLNKTLVVVVSKTGSTLETQTNEALVRERFKEKGLDPQKHFIGVTSKGSMMDNTKNYLECFYMWDWVGGRLSTSSMGGGVMLSFAFGFDVYFELLRGAHAMDQAALSKDIKTNLPLLGALLSVWNRNFLGYPTLALIPYSQALSRYSAHIQQVEMECNGKRIDKKGHPVDFHTAMIIWGEPGTNAQHSFYQMIHQGTDIVPLEFIGFKESQYGEDLDIHGTTSQQKLLSNLFAQMLALATGQNNENPNKYFPGNRPSHLLLAEKLTPFIAGCLLAYFEHKVAFEGFIWDINSFDQEGVQLGKVLAEKILNRFSAKNTQKKSEEYPLGDFLISELETFPEQR